MPSQMLNLHSENMFLLFIFYLKCVSTIEQNKLYVSNLTLCNVKWSIRLYFYVCYGFYPYQFMQYIKKKEHQNIIKEFLTVIFKIYFFF
jgi:hypothetical protein